MVVANATERSRPQITTIGMISQGMFSRFTGIDAPWAAEPF
jgi:hypothetical protein